MSAFESIFQSSPVPSCIITEQGSIYAANAAFCKLTAYASSELRQMDYWSLLPENQQNEKQSVLEDLLTEQDGGQTSTTYLRCKDKRLVELQVQAHILSDIHPPGRHLIFQYQQINQDINDTQRLRRLEERFNLSQRHAHYGVWDWNIQTNDLYWSEQIGPLIGLGDGELDANYLDFVNSTHPDDRDFMAEAVRAAIEDGAEYNIEHRSVWPDGTVRWLRETGDVIRDKDGTPLKMIGVARDVTDNHMMEEGLKERESLLKQAQAIAHVGHWSWDVATGRLTWSDEIYRIFGYEPGEFEPTYDKFIATLHPDDVDLIKQSEQAAFARGEPHSIDHRIILPDGNEAWVHEEAVALNDETGSPIRLTGTVQDITARKKLEQQLADKIEQAEAANFAKSTFLSHMSHELRTPLNAILGFAQIMEMEKLSDSLANYVKEIMSSGWHLLDLVDDLLDLSRIESGSINLHIESVNLNELVTECRSMINPLLSERKLKFKSTYQECDHYVKADQRRLKQILLNLFSNAVKYNRPGGEIEIFCTDTADSLRIHVRDTGEGIAKELLPRLFTPFDRLGKEGIVESGTGIGLTLVKRLTEAMGGKLGVESIEGKGSTFWFELALATSIDNQLAELNNNYNQGKDLMTLGKINVLYVEDNPANLRLIEGFMGQKENLHLLAAQTATEGLALARQQQPDVILMDIKLPDMNGFEALARLKTFPETSNIPVIAVSAVAHEHDVAAGLSAGFYRYITKPINLEHLEEAMVYACKEPKTVSKDTG